MTDMQGGIPQGELDILGAALSLEVSCAIRLPQFMKEVLFVCKCGIPFPFHSVKVAHESKDWTKIREIHEKLGGEQ